MRVEISDNTFFDIPELESIFGVGKKAIYGWIQGGKLKAHRVGKKYLVYGSDLKRFILSVKKP